MIDRVLEDPRSRIFSRYRASLYVEDPLAWLELEKFILTLRARLNMPESDAAELVCLIVYGPRKQARRYTFQNHRKEKEIT